MKYRVLFVDDDANLLAGLRRTLRGLQEEWDMRFAGGGAEALDLLAVQPCDVIVTDMRMPGMDGAELLNEIRNRHPGMLRIVLSGYSEQESVMRMVGPAHQFLAKPCTRESVVEVIRRGLELRRLLESEALRTLVAGLKTLPTPSDTYFALTAYMKDPQASVSGVAEIIDRDLAMTANLLKLTNSAYFAMPSRVTSPLQAVRVLGFETLAALVLRVGIFRHFAGGDEKVIEEISRDSLLVARLARRIGKVERLQGHDLEDSFCAGMLSSIGLLVLLDRLPEKIDRVREAVDHGRDILAAETSVFGATHLQLGAYLLGLWGFNKAVVEAVAFSGSPGIAPASRLEPAGAVHVARVLAGPVPPYGARLALDQGYLEGLGATERVAGWKAEAAAESAR